MDTGHTILIATAALAFGVALLAVITEWLKADEVAADVEKDMRANLERMRTGAQDPPETATLAVNVALDAEVPATPALADDETALSRLFFGWGIAGMVTGMALGAVMWGAVGALLGGVVLTAASIGLVVVAVLAIDHARAEHAAKRRAAEPAEARTSNRAHAH